MRFAGAPPGRSVVTSTQHFSVTAMWLATGDGGGWRPGIGDPTFVGWLTVVVYFTTAWLCVRAYRRLGAGHGPTGAPWQLRWWWRGLSILLVLLGINKQLDLQTLFTEVARSAAHSQGWYEQRKAFQKVFIALLAFSAVLVSTAAMVVLRAWLRRLWLGVVGLGLLMGFVTIRAVSFHHVDQMLGFELLGLRFNWIMELGALALIAKSAVRAGGKPTLPSRFVGRRRNRSGREEIRIRVQVRSPDKPHEETD